MQAQYSLNVDYALQGCLDMVEEEKNLLVCYFSPFFAWKFFSPRHLPNKAIRLQILCTQTFQATRLIHIQVHLCSQTAK